MGSAILRWGTAWRVPGTLSLYMDVVRVDATTKGVSRCCGKVGDARAGDEENLRAVEVKEEGLQVQVGELHDWG